METRFLLRLRDHHVLFGLVIWATLVLPSPSISVRSCSFPAMFNFGDSNSDTGGPVCSFWTSPLPKWRDLFPHPIRTLLWWASSNWLHRYFLCNFSLLLKPLSLSSPTLQNDVMFLFLFLFLFSLCYNVMVVFSILEDISYYVRCRKGFGKLEKRNSFWILLASDLKLCCMWLHFMKDLDPPKLSLPSWKTGQKFSFCMHSLVKNNMLNMPKVLGSVLQSHTKHVD